MNSEDAIRDAAHSKWEAEGRPDGQHERHWSEAEEEIGGSAIGTAQSGSGDHHHSVSPPTSTGSVEEEQVVEPSNDWPAAAGISDAQNPNSAEETRADDDRRTSGDGDIDRP